MKILIGVTGSVAAIKLAAFIVSLKSRRERVEIKVVVTQRGMQFLNSKDIESITSLTSGLYTDEHEWSEWKTKGDPVVHIELRKWADIFVISPLSANSLAKIAVGMCDNLLTCIVRAWPTKNITDKRFIVCPAMNTCMWDNALTSTQLLTLQQIYRAEIVMPKEMHVLACGDVGAGAMADIEQIVDIIFSNS